MQMIQIRGSICPERSRSWYGDLTCTICEQLSSAKRDNSVTIAYACTMLVASRWPDFSYDSRISPISACLPVCVRNQLCTNRSRLWHLDKIFACRYSDIGIQHATPFLELQRPSLTISNNFISKKEISPRKCRCSSEGIKKTLLMVRAQMIWCDSGCIPHSLQSEKYCS